jgi:hypothetical protein
VTFLDGMIKHLDQPLIYFNECLDLVLFGVENNIDPSYSAVEVMTTVPWLG